MSYAEKPDWQKSLEHHEELFVSIELICHLQMKFPLKTPFMPSKTRLKYLMPV